MQTEQEIKLDPGAHQPVNDRTESERYNHST